MLSFSIAKKFTNYEVLKIRHTSCTFQTIRNKFTISNLPVPKTPEYFQFRNEIAKPEDFDDITKGLKIYPEFITQEEHDALVKEADAFFKDKKYVIDHWDDVISNYKETEKNNWPLICQNALNKVRSMFLGEVFWKYGVHVIDLDANGPIGPHIDAITNSGEILAGLSLLSTTVMTLKRNEAVVDLLLPPKSLYIMTDKVRYEFTHEIPATDYTWKGNTYPRQRRISIMFRDETEDMAEMIRMARSKAQNM